MVLSTMASLCAACNREKTSENTSSDPSINLPVFEQPAPPKIVLSDDEPEPTRRKDALKDLAPQVDENGMTISQWPSITLSGDPDEIIEIQEDCFYEGERFFIFFQNGVKIRGDVAEHLDRIMYGLEDLLQLSYERDPVNSDINWRYLYFDNAFTDVNRDLAKVNILIIKNPGDGAIEWAGENVAVLFEEDVFDPEHDLETAYHELAHVLQLRQASPFGRVLAEGIAAYAEYQMCIRENRPAWDTAGYLTDRRNPSIYDESLIYTDPVGTFMHDTEIDGGHNDWEYQYGIRFVTFLVETYGVEVFDKMCRISLEFTYEEARTDMIIRVIKEATSDDVFEQFAAWLPEGWERFGEEYEEYMKQFDPMLQMRDSTQVPA